MTRKAPALAEATVIRQWAGMYDVTPDHHAIVGLKRQLDGWWLAHGWSGRGMLLAPYLTSLLAEQIATGRADPLLAARSAPIALYGVGSAASSSRDGSTTTSGSGC